MSKPKPIDFRRAVLAQMDRHNLTTTQLAQQAGILRPNLARWLQSDGDRQIRSDVLARLLTAAKITLHAE